MKIPGLTILELTVSMIIIGIIALLSYNILFSFNDQFVQSLEKGNEEAGLRNLAWRIERATFFCDSITLRDRTVLWNSDPDSLKINFQPDSTIIEFSGLVDVLPFGFELETSSLSEKNQVIQNIRLKKMDETEKEWIFFKDYPSEILYPQKKQEN